MRFLQINKSSILLGLILGLTSLLGCQSLPSSTFQHSSNTPADLPESIKSARPIHIIAGTYNQKGSEGIYGFHFDSVALKFSEPELLAKAKNPSFMTVDKDKVYVVNELADGHLSTYQVLDGQLSLLTSIATEGASPCYISISPDRSYIATANYMGGNLSIFALNDSSLPLSSPQTLQHSGHGANKSRQEAPHAHWVQWSKDQTLLYAVDLGIDEIKAYPFDKAMGRVGEPFTALTLSPGDGPRHLFFHPSKPFAYVLNELSNTVTVASIDDKGILSSIQKIETLPDAFTGHNQGGHIYVTEDGKTLYTSNRGHNSIAVFDISQNGRLTLNEFELSQGRWPRHFLVLEEEGVMLVANQEGHNIVALAIADDGSLSSTGSELELPQVTFLGRL